jgi:hypothetical protein
MNARTEAMALILLATLFGSAPALACECRGTGYIDARIARAQKHAFMFRVLATEMDARHPTLRSNGRIEVLATIKGDGARFHSIRMPIGMCCGLRLQAGSTYFAFTSQDGSRLYAHTGNILELPQHGEEDLRLLREMMAGKSDLQEHQWRYSFANLMAYGRSGCPRPEVN